MLEKKMPSGLHLAKPFNHAVEYLNPDSEVLVGIIEFKNKQDEISQVRVNLITEKSRNFFCGVARTCGLNQGNKVSVIDLVKLNQDPNLGVLDLNTEVQVEVAESEYSGNLEVFRVTSVKEPSEKSSIEEKLASYLK